MPENTEGTTLTNETKLLDTVLKILDHQGEELSPSQLLALLSLCNLLGIVSFLARQNVDPPAIADNAPLPAIRAQNKGTEVKKQDTQWLMNTILSLAGSKSGQKINPATLLPLIKLLSEGETKKKAEDTFELNTAVEGTQNEHEVHLNEKQE